MPVNNSSLCQPETQIVPPFERSVDSVLAKLYRLPWKLRINMLLSYRVTKESPSPRSLHFDTHGVTLFLSLLRNVDLKLGPVVFAL